MQLAQRLNLEFFRSIPVLDIPYWKEFAVTLIDYCLQISQIVSPVVQNSSPEGNIPEEVIGGTFPKLIVLSIWLPVIIYLLILITSFSLSTPYGTSAPRTRT